MTGEVLKRRVQAAAVREAPAEAAIAAGTLPPATQESESLAAVCDDKGRPGLHARDQVEGGKKLAGLKALVGAIGNEKSEGGTALIYILV